MGDKQTVSSQKKFYFLCNIYLGFFVFIGAAATLYFGITNYKVHEALINKSLIACLFLTIATAMLFFFDVERRVNIALSHFSICFGVFAINAFFEIPWAQPNAVQSAAHRAGIKWDDRTKYEAVEDSRKEGINAYPTAFFSAFVTRKEFFAKNYGLNFENTIFPLSGISNTKTFLCNESGEWVSYFSDRYGFNNDDSVYEDSQRSVILLGDSFTHGACVKSGEDTASNLRRFGYKAISLGTGGNGPLLELASLIEYAPHLNSKVVLWMYFEGNDFKDLPGEYNYNPLKRYIDEGYTQNLIQKQEEIDKFWIDFFEKAKKDLKNETREYVFWDQDRSKEINGLIRRLISLHNIRKRLGLSRGSYILQSTNQSVSSDEAEILFRIVMERALQETKKLNSTLYFVYLPSYENFFSEKYSLAPSSVKVRKVLNELGIPIIDFYEHLKASGDPAAFFPYRESGHYSAKGYAYLAEFIKEQALLRIKK